MLISTKEFRIYLAGLERKILSSNNPNDDSLGTLRYTISQIEKDVAEWESHHLKELGEPPCGLGVDKEMALVVYCGRKLYDFVEKFSVDTEEDVNVLTIGKIYLEVKKALREGKFKRV